MEDLYEWKTALENALALAPSATNGTEQNGISRNKQTDSIDISVNQCMLLLNCALQMHFATEFIPRGS